LNKLFYLFIYPQGAPQVISAKCALRDTGHGGFGFGFIWDLGQIAHLYVHQLMSLLLLLHLLAPTPAAMPHCMRWLVDCSAKAPPHTPFVQ
jgi:hypothetical protein